MIGRGVADGDRGGADARRLGDERVVAGAPRRRHRLAVDGDAERARRKAARARPFDDGSGLLSGGGAEAVIDGDHVQRPRAAGGERVDERRRVRPARAGDDPTPARHASERLLDGSVHEVHARRIR